MSSLFVRTRTAYAHDTRQTYGTQDSEPQAHAKLCEEFDQILAQLGVISVDALDVAPQPERPLSLSSTPKKGMAERVGTWAICPAAQLLFRALVTYGVYKGAQNPFTISFGLTLGAALAQPTYKVLAHGAPTTPTALATPQAWHSSGHLSVYATCMAAGLGLLARSRGDAAAARP